MSNKGDPGGGKGRRRVTVEGAPAERVKKPGGRSLDEILGPAEGEAKEVPEGVVTYHPARVEQFLAGYITLGELEGISKPEQYEMAKVGFSYMTAGKLDKAKTVFEGLLALDPFDAYFHTALGSIAQQVEDLKEAEARYSRALEINPFSPTALANRGEIRVIQGRLEEGAQDLAKALLEDPEAREPASIRARATLQALREKLEELKLSRTPVNVPVVPKAPPAPAAVEPRKPAPPAPPAVEPRKPAQPAPRPALPRAARPGPRPAPRPGPRKK